MNHFVTCFAIVFLVCGPLLASVGIIYYLNYYVADITDEQLLIESKSELATIQPTLESDLERYDKDIENANKILNKTLDKYDIDMTQARKHVSAAARAEELLSEISPFVYIKQIWDEKAVNDIKKLEKGATSDILYDVVDTMNEIRELESAKRDLEKSPDKLERIINSLEKDIMLREEAWDSDMQCFPICYKTCDDASCSGYIRDFEKVKFEPQYKYEGIILLGGIFITITGGVLFLREID